MMEASTPKNIQCTRYEGIVCCIVAQIYDEIVHPALYMMQEFWGMVSLRVICVALQRNIMH